MSKKTPHIYVDAFPLVDSHFSGIGHYTHGIVAAFDELAGEGKIEYSLIAPRNWAHRLHQYNFQNYKKIIKNPFSNRVIRGFLKYRINVPIDLFIGHGYYYFPSFIRWPLWFSKSATVVHDVTFLAVPHCVHKANGEYMKAVVPVSMQKSNKVLTVSDFSKEEINKYYGVKKSKIDVATPCVDRAHFYKRSEKEVKKIRAKYDIYSENYILSVGNIEPRKNYNELIDAYMQLPKSITDKYWLVIIGAGGWNNEEILDKIQHAKEQGYRIIQPKAFVPDEDMPALYSGASLYVFTPIYEGFGMSPLESYACGTPAVVSKVASVPQAAGDAAVYIDPYDANDITAKIGATLKDIEHNPDFRKKEMQDHIDKFSWRKSAITTIESLTGYRIDED